MDAEGNDGVGPDPLRDGTPRAVRVVIIGGGCAGMAAAWQLSRLPNYEVSVYEQSWRLGGKGASGRSADGSIHEHGLHVWLGFYENAFRMVRECYAEVGKRNWGPHRDTAADRLAHASFEDAFLPEPHIGVTGRNASGHWTVWSGYLPPEKGLPGDPLDPETNPFTLASYLLRCVDLLKTLMLSVIAEPTADVPGQVRPEGRSAVDEAVDLDFSLDPAKSPELLIQRIASRVRDGTLTAAAAMLQAITIVENMLQDLNHSPQITGSALNLMKALAGQMRKQLREIVDIDEKLRWKTEIIDIVMTIAVGLYRDRVLLDRKGLDALNDMDYREWLLKHGATKTAVDSRFITGIYDLVFAYEGGNRARPRLAAGVALRGALRMFFTYRGAMFWRMRSGMGDAVFAPLYKVMARERAQATKEGVPAGVRFHFMHRLSEITFEDRPGRGKFVRTLTFATTGAKGRIVNPGDQALDHFGCWPDSDRGLLGQAEPSPVSDETVLEAGHDFDVVILATSLDDCAQVLRARKNNSSLPAAWASLRTPGQTVATKAAQVWMTQDLEQLGWYRGSGIISALGLSFGTWADMTHTLPAERAWRVAVKRPADDRARSVAYFCGVMSEDEERRDRVAMRRMLLTSLATLLTGMRRLWPRARSGAGHAMTLGIVKWHLQANIAGSNRYSLSLPGTIRDRISPLDRSVLNMTVAGDWTACGLDAGCVEAAVMSGMLAAHAVTGGTPTLNSIIGYDHP
jgi:uncharacterized protein with NAD-binding domain and iron-sulfur cluster